MRWRNSFSKPGVLDDNDGLLGEVLDKIDLLFGEWTDFVAKMMITLISTSSFSIGSKQ